MTLRAARDADTTALARIDAATWSPHVSPAPAPKTDAVWTGKVTADAVIVAELDGEVVGSVVVGQMISHLATHAHVLEIKGLAVDPAHQGAGIGRALVLAACEHAQQTGARKLSLRVLGTNPSARGLYEACGFAPEGTLRGEFLIEGALVDDVLMARWLSP